MPGIVGRINKLRKKVAVSVTRRFQNPEKVDTRRVQRREESVRKLGVNPEKLNESGVRKILSVKREIRDITAKQDQLFRLISAHLKPSEKREALEELRLMVARKIEKWNPHFFIQKKLGKTDRERMQKLVSEYLQLEKKIQDMHKKL